MPDSFNVLPALLGESPTGRDYVLEHAGRVAIRQGKWKFIPGTGGKNAKRGPSGGDALYDLPRTRPKPRMLPRNIPSW